MFSLPFAHPGHEHFKSCSGAPILSNDGALVALVSSGKEETNEIWGISVSAYKTPIISSLEMSDSGRLFIANCHEGLDWLIRRRDNDLARDHMPQQEVFFEQQSGGRRVEVLKVYDQHFAREAFNSMDEDAQTALWNSLNVEKIYDPAGLPTPEEPEDRTAFLWDELVEQAREDYRTFSFFVVTETTGTQSENLYISPDWPSAEAFAKTRLAA